MPNAVISTKYVPATDRYQVSCNCGHVGPERVTTNDTAKDVTAHRKECPNVHPS